MRELDQRATVLESRLCEISDEITLLCGPSDAYPGQSFDADIRPRIRALHAERDTLDAELTNVRSRLASRATAAPVKLPLLARAAPQPSFPRDAA